MRDLNGATKFRMFTILLCVIVLPQISTLPRITTFLMTMTEADYKLDDPIFKVWEINKGAVKNVNRKFEEEKSADTRGMSDDFGLLTRKRLLSSQDNVSCIIGFIKLLQPPEYERTLGFIQDGMGGRLLKLKQGSRLTLKHNRESLTSFEGFTALSDKCSLSGEIGVYKLTSIINDFLGKMVGEVYQHGGDVWKFSGDAFLAYWKVSLDQNLSQVIHRALRCAFVIQKTHGYHQTDMKTILRVKVGISVGNVVWCLAGDSQSRSRRYLLIGAPVWEVKKAESICQSGDVILGPSAFGHISPRDCVHEALEGGFVRVLKIVGYMGLLSPSEMKQVGAPGFEIHQHRSYEGVREFPDLKSRVDLGCDLRTTQLSPVIQQIDADLSLDFLTELRTLTLMFINIIPKQIFNTDLLRVVDKSFFIIRKVVQAGGGSIDKVTTFDKDIMFLVIYGLRGFHHEGRIPNILTNGYDIREACMCIAGVQDLAVGIATGMTYCGVVGHPLRQAFTTIGPSVNKAARLIQAYPGQVTCDSATYARAAILKDFFIPAPYRPLRGFSQDDQCYEFNADRRRLMMSAMARGFPVVVGREAEMNAFRAMLTELDNPERVSCGFFIVGEAKIGKSRLIAEMIAETYNQQHDAFVFGVRSSHSIVPYSAALRILCEALNMQKACSWQSLVLRLSQLLEGKIKANDLTCIEKMVSTLEKDFHSTPKVTNQMKRVFLATMLMTTTWTVIAIDDVDFCDTSSMELILSLVEAQPRPLIILSAELNRTDYDLNIPGLNTLRLDHLDDQHIGSLACQLTKAEAITTEVSRFLERRCHGSPGWCHFQIQTLLDEGYIEVKEVSETKKGSLQLQYPGQTLLQERSISLPNPPPVVQVKEKEVVIDEREFDYLDMLRTSRVIGTHKWWQKSVRHLASHNQFKSGVERGNVEPAQQSDSRASRRETYEWSDLVRGMFTTGKGTIVTEKESTTFIPVEMTPDQIYIQEGLEAFKKLKAAKDDGGDKHGDYSLDTLAKYRSSSTIAPIYGRSHANLIQSKLMTTQDEMNSKLSSSSTTALGLQRRPSAALSTGSTGSRAESMGAHKFFAEEDDNDEHEDDEFDDERQSKTTISGRTIYLSPPPGSVSPSTTVTRSASGTTRKEGWTAVVARLPGKDITQCISPESYGGLLSVFDSLRPFDQLLLKCSSVIGMKIKRNMLEDILHWPNPSNVAIAIKRLFELNIFYCANSPNTERRCECHPFERPADYSLPSYSFCAEFGFRYPKLRDTMYNLLPPNQKKIFHQRAVEHLMGRDRRCGTCLQQVVTSYGSSKKSSSSSSAETTIYSTLTGGFIEKTKLNLSNELKSANIPNFLICTCLLMELEGLGNLIEHSSAAGLVVEHIHYTLELAKVHLDLSENEECRKALNWVQTQITENTDIKSSDLKKLNSHSALIEGQLEYELGNVDLARKHLLRVLKNNFSLCYRSRRGSHQLALISRLWLKLYSYGGSVNDVKALNLLTIIAIEQNEYKEANFFCSLALNMLHYVDNPYEHSLAFANKVDIELQLYNEPFFKMTLFHIDENLKLTNLALKILPVLTVQDAQALAFICHAIYVVKVIIGGHLREFGELVVGLNRLARHTHMTRGLDFTTLEMFHVQIQNNEIKEAAETLLPLKGGTSIQQFWFHALALDFLRLTGYWLEPFNQSEGFLTYALTVASPDRSAYRRGVTSLISWLVYFDRNKALEWQNKMVVTPHAQTIHNVSEGSFRVQEILALIMQIRALPESPFSARFKRIVRQWIADFSDLSHMIPLIRPYYIFIKAYYCAKVDGNLARGFHFLNEGETLARAYNNEVLRSRFQSARDVFMNGSKSEEEIANMAAQAREWSEYQRGQRSSIIFGII